MLSKAVDIYFALLLMLLTFLPAHANDISGINSTNAFYTSANVWIWSKISISDAPAGAESKSVKICWSVNSNYCQDIKFSLRKPSDVYISPLYQMYTTGPDNVYGFTQNSSSCIMITPPIGTAVNGDWYFYIMDYIVDSSYFYNLGMIDWWNIKISYESPKKKFSWEMFMPAIQAGSNIIESPENPEPAEPQNPLRSLETPKIISPGGGSYVHSNSVEFRWTAVPGAANYEIVLETATGSNFTTKIEHPTAKEANCSDGTGECSYYWYGALNEKGRQMWQVRAMNGSQTSSYSTPTIFYYYSLLSHK